VCFEREGGKVLVLLLIGRIPGAPFAAPLTMHSIAPSSQFFSAQGRARTESNLNQTHPRTDRNHNIESFVSNNITSGDLVISVEMVCYMRFCRSSLIIKFGAAESGEFSGLFQGNRSRSEIDL
jgi:hypothetical protein